MSIVCSPRGVDKVHPLQNIRWEVTFSLLYLVTDAEFDGEQGCLTLF